MDPSISIPEIPNDILHPQAYALNGYSRSILRNPYHIANQRKKIEPSIYETKHALDNIAERDIQTTNIMRNKPIALQDEIDAQMVFKLTESFLEENGLSERLHKPIVDLEKVSADQDTKEISPNIEQDQITVRFEEQDRQVLHERFMKYVSNAIHYQRTRPNTSDDSTLYRPTTTSTGRSSTAMNTKKSFQGEKVQSVLDNSVSRPTTCSTLQNRVKSAKRFTYQPKPKTDIEKAKMVVDFFHNSPFLTAQRFKGPKSLADWRIEKKTEEQVWDSGSFSVQEFMRDYVKFRELEAETEIKKVERKKKSCIKTEASLASNHVVTQRNSIMKAERAFHNVPNKRDALGHGSILLPKNNRTSQLHFHPVINSGVRKYTDENPECGRILSKIPLDRTPEEKLLLFKMFRDFKAFKKLSDFTLGEVVGALVLQEFEAQRAIFKQGDQGTVWYIILSGNVSVQVSRTGKIEDSIEVAKLRDGDGFGELALANDEPRAATVLSIDFCQLIYIDRSDFNRIVKFTYEKELKEKMLFLKKCPLLASSSFPALKSVAEVMEWKKFQPGACVIAEGAKSQHLYIVRSGEAVVTRAIKIPEKDLPVKVVIGRLRRHDYFGEQGVHFMDSDPSSCESDAMPSSIFAAKNGKELEIGIIACFDAKNKITHIPKNLVHNKTVGEILRIYHEDKLKKKWVKQKKVFFDKMLREKCGDPNMDTEKWRNLSKKKKVWVL